MKKLFNLAKWTLSRGKDPQNFLGAGWIPRFLRTVPERSRRRWALRILSLSPHYFIKPDLPKFRGMSFDAYLESSLRDIAASREEIYERVFKSPLSESKTVIDYGCGPGFLAAVAARDKEKVFAVDISVGALACAAVINGADQIVYLRADDDGLSQIPDGGADGAMSLAVVQHLTDDTLRTVLGNIARKLRSGGTLAMHVQTESRLWRSEDEWRQDPSVMGSIKFKCGLHCFGRSLDAYETILKEKGFVNISSTKLSDLMLSDPDNDDSEHVVTANKP